jgi:zinc transporter ZupT
MASSSENQAMAWACTCTAALSTLLGAACIFVLPAEEVPQWAISASMSMAAGVMIYLSVLTFCECAPGVRSQKRSRQVTEMFSKAEESFGKAGNDELHAKLYANLCFFGGAFSKLRLGPTPL